MDFKLKQDFNYLKMFGKKEYKIESTFRILYLKYAENINKINFMFLMGILISGIVVYVFTNLFDYINYGHFANISLTENSIPILVSFFIWEIANILKKYSKNDLIKMILPLIITSVISTIIIVTHYSYSVTLILPAISIFLSVVYGDASLTKFILAINKIDYVVAMFFIIRHNGGKFIITLEEFTHLESYQYVISLVTGIILMHLSYYIAVSITEFEKKKNELYTQELTEKKYYKATSELDGLTNLYNKMFLRNIATKWIKNEENVFAVMMDIDHFKRVNDTYGHSFGDIVLMRLASILKQYQTENIIVARYGGEEFSIIFKNADNHLVRKTIKSIREEFEAQIYEGINDKFTISGGGFKMTNEKTFEELFEKADKALYYSKENGRNQFTLFTPEDL